MAGHPLYESLSIHFRKMAAIWICNGRVDGQSPPRGCFLAKAKSGQAKIGIMTGFLFGRLEDAQVWTAV